MLTIFVRYDQTTGREHVGNWAVKAELPANRIDDLSAAELHELHDLIRLHGIEGIRVLNEERRVIWPPPAGEPYVALERKSPDG
jgi:hypothetical protein